MSAALPMDSTCSLGGPAPAGEPAGAASTAGRAGTGGAIYHRCATGRISRKHGRRSYPQNRQIPAIAGEAQYRRAGGSYCARRPDIKQAERDLAAATARIGVAEANLFPHVTLLGGAGYQQQGLNVSPSLTSFIWSAGPFGIGCADSGFRHFGRAGKRGRSAYT